MMTSREPRCHSITGIYYNETFEINPFTITNTCPGRLLFYFRVFFEVVVRDKYVYLCVRGMS